MNKWVGTSQAFRKGSMMSVLTFGKYKDKDIEDIPDHYLKWLIVQSTFEGKYPDLVKEIDKEIAYRDKWDKHIIE